MKTQKNVWIAMYWKIRNISKKFSNICDLQIKHGQNFIIEI